MLCMKKHNKLRGYVNNHYPRTTKNREGGWERKEDERRPFKTFTHNKPIIYLHYINAAIVAPDITVTPRSQIAVFLVS